MTASSRIDPRRIDDAPRWIDPVFLRSPQYECEALGDAFGVRLILKVETANPIRSFKGRGAELFVARDAGNEALVCGSAGNFGQAMAYACRSRALPVTVFASAHANALKLARMRDLGADVRLAGDDFDGAKAAARAFAAAEGRRFVEDGREVAIAEGAGTIAAELLAGEHALDAVFIPLGNGALLSGMASILRARSPATRIVAVAAEGAPAMARSLREGRAVTTLRTDTIADGIAVRVPVPEALADLRGLVDDVRLVGEASIVEAMRAVWRHAGLLVEPSGVVGVAALAVDADPWRGATVATVLCGGNVEPERALAWLARV